MSIPMRPAHRALLLLLCLFVAFVLSFADAWQLRTQRAAVTHESADLVERLGLTDPVLFTEARYTRHLSQADLQSAFQDHPVALEHFPTGSLIAPPATLLQAYEYLDRKTASPD